MKKKPDKKVNAALIPVEEDVNNLLNMFEFFLTERQFGQSVEALGETVKDMRIIIGRILVDHFMNLDAKEEGKFCTALAGALATRAANLPCENKNDEAYEDYLVGEILTSFEYAQGVKEDYQQDHVLQKILALDIPILRPFDYGLRGRLKVVHGKKRRRMH